MGKGDKRRPSSITLKKFSDNWDKIFSKKCVICGTILFFIEGNEPFDTDHYQCPNCDSTFNTFDKNI